jgi:hypothetical protein
MWGNPTRERERDYYSASGKYSTTAKSHFQPREIPHSHKKQSQNFLPWKTCPSPYSCTTSSKSVPRKPCPTECCTACTVRPNTKTPKSASISVPKGASKIVPSFLLYGLYGSVQYDPTQKMEQTHTEKCLGICALLFLGKCALQAAHFPLSSLLRKSLSITSLVFSMCLAHYPMHSFINLKMTFSLQSVFSPSPTLNPKAKIRSCLFQDQGS